MTLSPQVTSTRIGVRRLRCVDLRVASSTRLGYPALPGASTRDTEASLPDCESIGGVTGRAMGHVHAWDMADSLGSAAATTTATPSSTSQPCPPTAFPPAPPPTSCSRDGVGGVIRGLPPVDV